MKAPAYQMYAADYLADEVVMLMSLEAEGAYIRLLNYCWREGSIPADPKLLSRMAKFAPAEAIAEVLPCFYPDSSQPGRLLHKRLEEERAKQEAHRAKQAENGRHGGRPRKATDKPTESQEKAVGYSGETQTEAKKSLSSSSSSSRSTNVDGPPKMSDDLKARAEAQPDTTGELLYDVSPLTKPLYFKRVCAENAFPNIDFEHYRLQALAAAKRDNVSRTIKQWESWIVRYLNNQPGPLLKAATVDLSQPTPREQLPTPGTDCTGRHIVLQNTGDQNMNRMAAATYTKHFPNATIHHTR